MQVRQLQCFSVSSRAGSLQLASDYRRRTLTASWKSTATFSRYDRSYTVASWLACHILGEHLPRVIGTALAMRPSQRPSIHLACVSFELTAWFGACRRPRRRSDVKLISDAGSKCRMFGRKMLGVCTYHSLGYWCKRPCTSMLR